MSGFEDSIAIARFGARLFKQWDYWIDQISFWDDKHKMWRRELVFIDLMSDEPHGRTIGHYTDFGLEMFPN